MIDIHYQPPIDWLLLDVAGTHTSELNELLAAVDHYHEHNEAPITELRTRAGKVLAYVEDRLGPAPDGVSADAIARGRLIFLAADDWRGRPDSPGLKAGRKTLLEQHGD